MCLRWRCFPSQGWRACVTRERPWRRGPRASSHTLCPRDIPVRPSLLLSPSLSFLLTLLASPSLHQLQPPCLLGLFQAAHASFQSSQFVAGMAPVLS